MKLLENKIALITGAARGMGKATMELFSSHGAIIYATDIRGELLEESVLEISSKYDAKIIALEFDVTDTIAQKKAFSRIFKDEGRLDILVNNAGISLSALMEMSRKDDIERVFAINSIAIIEMIQQAARLMKRNEINNGTRGSIINISSIAGTHGNRGQIAYSGSKAAVIGITKSAGKELAPFLIRVNAIAPGLIRTPMLDETLSDEIVNDYLTNNVGMHLEGEAMDIANTVLFLAADSSKYITAQVIGVDGGYVL